jgi:hypothetical protein
VGWRLQPLHPIPFCCGLAHLPLQPGCSHRAAREPLCTPPAEELSHAVGVGVAVGQREVAVCKAMVSAGRGATRAL